MENAPACHFRTAWGRGMPERVRLRRVSTPRFYVARGLTGDGAGFHGVSEGTYEEGIVLCSECAAQRCLEHAVCQRMGGRTEVDGVQKHARGEPVHRRCAYNLHLRLQGTGLRVRPTAEPPALLPY